MSFQLLRLKAERDLLDWARQTVFKLNQFFATRAEVQKCQTLTISGGTATTTVSDEMASSMSIMLVMPTNPAAQGINWYIDPSETTDQSLFVLHHDTISVTATFCYSIIT